LSKILFKRLFYKGLKIKSEIPRVDDVFQTDMQYVMIFFDLDGSDSVLSLNCLTIMAILMNKENQRKDGWMVYYGYT
jgi:hypothetical protein